MKIVKTGIKQYPLRVTLSDGTVLKVPKQANFNNNWLRTHGCSLMAEYLALQYIGKHVYPLHLLQWHRAYDKEDVRAKVTVKGVAKGINHYKPDHARYDPTPSLGELESAMKAGACVVFEQKNPIHSIFIFREDGKNYMISYGQVKKIDLAKIAKTATANANYKGMVIVKRKV